jgi:hypothetical protein
MLLTSTSDLIKVVTGSAGTVEVRADWADASGSPVTVAMGRTNTAAISTATTTTVVASPGASTSRKVKQLSVKNDDASASNAIEVQHTDGSNVITVWEGTLLAGEQIVYGDVFGWQYLDANGNPKLAASKLDAKLRVTLDVVNATTSFADVTGLTVAVESGKKYAFECVLHYIGNATTTGARFGYNGPSMTNAWMGQTSASTPGIASTNVAAGVATAVDTAIAASTTGPGATPAIAHLAGYINPSAAGTFAIRCASEVAVAAGLTIKAGSFMRIYELDN